MAVLGSAPWSLKPCNPLPLFAASRCLSTTPPQTSPLQEQPRRLKHSFQLKLAQARQSSSPHTDPAEAAAMAAPAAPSHLFWIGQAYCLQCCCWFWRQDSAASSSLSGDIICKFIVMSMDSRFLNPYYTHLLSSVHGRAVSGAALSCCCKQNL